ncbi:hypothetical protein EDC42_1218 [Methanobrevibacter gottschalkii DSM 11977]|uniref:Uncharacterized protein n=2 Tax=Methanobacteriaceae TaxID=2159 RepID=A0A3N5B2L8_9EURY|nr:hypothetical protein EDC42_1218 [Methanobrevibacter gottschalkii DSM 11977]
MIHILHQLVLVANSVIYKGDIMFDSPFSNYIVLTRNKTNESIKLDQRRVKLRENKNGLMALSYIGPLFEIMDLEDFFDDMISSEKLSMDISETGEFRVSFRGIIDGKGKNFPQNLDHKIILLQEPTCLDERVNIQETGFSKFKLKNEVSE